MSYNVDDFIADVADMIKKTARKSSVVRDLADDIADDRKLQDLADEIVEDIYEDADKDDCLFDSRNRINDNVIQEAMGAVLGVIANKQLSDREWDELDEKIYDALMDGVEVYKDACDRLQDNNYDNRSSRSKRSDRSGRSGSRNDRGRSRDNDRESRRNTRTSKRDRPARSSRTSTSTERSDPTKAARPYGNGGSARSRRNDGGDNEESANVSRVDIAAALEDTGIVTVAKLIADMDVENVTIKDLTDFIEHRRDFHRYIRNKAAINEYLESLQRPVIGGLGKDSLTGVVLPPDALLVNGEVKHVEHYMEHELDDNARRANMQRYGMRVPVPAAIPRGVEKSVIEIDTKKYDFINAGRFENRRSLDFVDYTDLSVDIARALGNKGDYVVAKMFRELSAVFSKEDVDAVFIAGQDGQPIAPESFFQIHEFLVEAAKRSLTDQAARFVAQLEEAATHTFNQCLHMADALFVIGSFHDDFHDAMAIIETKDRFVKETFTKQLADAYNSMYHFNVISTEVEEDGFLVSIKREITVFYSTNPIMSKARMSNEDYNTLYPNNYPELYRMLESIVEHRGAVGSDVVLVDALRNHYVINMRDVGVSAPIIIREI